MIKYLFRDVKKFKILYLTLFTLFVIAICTILSLLETYSNVDDAVNAFYGNYIKDDYMLYKKNLTEKELGKIEGIDSVEKVEGTIEADFRVKLDNDERRTLRIQSISKEIDKLYSYDSMDSKGLHISKKFMEENDLSLGDTLRISINGIEKEMKIVESIVNPSALFSIKSWNEPSPDGKYFSDAYMDISEYEKFGFSADMYNKVLIKVGKYKSDLENDLESIISNSKIVEKNEQISYITVNEEIGDLKTVSSFFIVIFSVCILSIIVVVTQKIIGELQKKIAYFKSIGIKNGELAKYFTLPYIGIVGISFIVGSCFSRVIGKILLGVYSDVFNLPEYDFVFHNRNFILILSVLAIIITIVYVFQYKKIKNMSVARVLKGEEDKIVKNSCRIGKGIPLFVKNVLRNILRNRGRSIFTGIAIIFSFILLITSFFFFDSLEHSLSSKVNEVNNYDYKIAFVKEMEKKEIADIMGKFDYQLEKAIAGELVMPEEELDVVISSSDSLKESILLKDIEGKEIDLENPNLCIIPYRYKQQFGINSGDNITVETVNEEGKIVKHDLKITNVVYEYTMFSVYVSPSIMKQIYCEDTYTSAYVNLDKEQEYKELTSIEEISTIEKNDYIYDSYGSIISGVEQFAKIIFIFSLVVLAAIFMGISYISLSTRKRDIAILKMLGAKNRYIYMSIMTEMNVILIVSLLVGIVISSPLKNILSSVFSNNRICFLPYIKEETYLMIILIIGILINLMMLYFFIPIRKINYKKELFR